MPMKVHTNRSGEYLARFEGLGAGERPPWSVLTFHGWLVSDLQFSEISIQGRLEDFENDSAAVSDNILFYSGNAYEVFIHSGLCFIQLEPYLDQAGLQKTVVFLNEVKRVLEIVCCQLRVARLDNREPEVEFEVNLLAEGDEAVDIFRKHCGDPDWGPM